MKISLNDHGEYFRGLLLLIARDSKVDERERELILLIGKLLGFEKEFCQSAVRDVLENKYIREDPPAFSSKEIAECFIKDGLQVALIDGELNEKEMELLRITAQRHNIGDEWITDELEVVGVATQLSALSLEASRLELK
jgi:hypothetical protein